MRGNFLYSFDFWEHTNVLQIKNNINSTRIEREKTKMENTERNKHNFKNLS